MNPAVRAKVTYSGAGDYAAFILDEEGCELDRFRGLSLGAVEEWLKHHYPDVPVEFVPVRNPARQTHCGSPWRKPAVSDRTLRYRSQTPECQPASPRVRAFGGSSRNVEVHHLDGHEEHTEPANLMWAYRSSDVRIGKVL